MNANTARRSTKIRLAVGAFAVAGAATVGGIAAVSPSSASADTPPAATTAQDAPVGSTAPGSAEHAGLVDGWLELWNGDYARAEGVVSPDVRVHAPMLDGGDGSAVRGPQGMVDWITQTRATAPDLHFTVEVGPIVDGDRIALRWIAEGTYAGTVPGAAAPAGTPISFTGTDLLRIEDGQVAEYWLNADTLGLLTQLQVSAS
ncbi:ester cyclase [Modestobacter sp. SSW1-42]|uniref:ester cyclase n=1 Tax=Modestobacter sp. SSW1-42 TaxID=596372 RepID=UPI00398582CC